MANFTICVSNNKTVNYDSFVGSKMSDAWMRKTYGRDWKDMYTALYFVKKPNAYGVVWVSEFNGKYDISIDTKLRKATKTISICDKYKIL